MEQAYKANKCLRRLPTETTWMDCGQLSNRCCSSIVSLKIDSKRRRISPMFQCHKYIGTWKHFPHYWPFVRRIHRKNGGFPHKGTVMQRFDISFVVGLNKLLNKRSSRRLFETTWCPCSVIVMLSSRKHIHMCGQYNPQLIYCPWGIWVIFRGVIFKLQ